MAKQSQVLRHPLKNILTNFSRILNNEVRFERDNTVASMSLPGLAYKDFTRAGIPAVWDVLRLTETNRILSVRYPEFAPQPLDSNPECIGVISAQAFKFNPIFYKKASINLPMTLTTVPGRLGKSSITILGQVYEEKTGDVFMEIERQFAFLNGKTGQATSMPESLNSLFQKYGRTDLPPFRITVPMKPDSTFSYTCKVPHSDSDMLYHTNQAMYIKYCMDCAASAQQAQYLTHFNDDVLALPVSSVSALYKSESFMDDVLQINMWQDQQSPETLHFQVQKENKEIVFSSISFQSQNPKSKL